MLARNAAEMAERKGEPNTIEPASGMLEFDTLAARFTPICRVRRCGTRPGWAHGTRESQRSCNMNRITGLRRGTTELPGLARVAAVRGGRPGPGPLRVGRRCGGAPICDWWARARAQ